MNRVEITGMVFGKRELRQTQNGRYIFTFSIGNSVKKGSELNFFKVNVWGELGVYLNQTMQDRMVYKIEGFLTQKKWESKDGKKMTSVEIVGTEVSPFDGRRERSKKESEQKTEPNKPIDDSPTFESEDLPF